MNKNLYINGFIKLSEKRLIRNDEQWVYDATDKTIWSKQLYKKASLHYPKFYKMDRMSKFGFLAIEFLLEKETIDSNTALIFSNKSASLDTDIKYSKSIQKDNFVPSPAVFVYTLPNIVMGEVSIRHKIHGENLFFVQATFSPSLYIEALQTLHLTKKMETAIIAWVEVLNNDINVFAALVSIKQTKNSVILNEETLTNFYNL